MADLQEQLQAILGNPEAMGQITAIARALTGGSPPPEASSRQEPEAQDVEFVPVEDASPEENMDGGPRAARPTEPRAARPTEPRTARPSEPGAAHPSEPGAAHPSEPGVAHPSEPEAHEGDGSAPDLSALLGMLGGGADIDPRLIQIALRVFSEYSAQDDEKVALLSALKPFLRAERLEKMEKAEKIARLSRVVRVAIQLLKEEGTGHV